MAFFQINQLSSGYGTTLILREINLNLEQGDIFCLLGRNGVGKTTLLKTVMGIIPVHEGEVYFSGKPISRLKPFQIAHRGIAYAPQEAGIFPNLTVEQNLRVGYRNSKAAFINACQQAFEHFPILEERLNQRAGTLSGGEQKMLILSRCMITQPRLMILDEITEGVQPSIIDRITKALKILNEQGTTLFLVEQNIKFALNIAHNYAVMNQGQIIEAGKVDSNTKEIVDKHLAL